MKTLIIITLTICLCLAGCALFKTGSSKSNVDSLSGAAVESARTQPLVWTFIIGAALSVLALRNGSKSAVGFLAACLFGLGLSLAVANFPKQIGFVSMCLSGGWFVRSVLFKKGGWSLKPKLDKLFKKKTGK